MSPAETVSTDGPVLPSDLVGQYTIAQSYELTPRKCMAFAAGVHDYKACYFDDTRPEELVGHPGLAFAFQWNSHYTAGRPYDVRAPMWRHLLHAGSDVRYARPFRIGDQITCQGRTVRLRPIKPGLLWEQRYTMVDASGATVVELDHSAIVRNARLEGPPREIDESPPLPQPAGPVGRATVDGVGPDCTGSAARLQRVRGHLEPDPHGARRGAGGGAAGHRAARHGDVDHRRPRVDRP